MRSIELAKMRIRAVIAVSRVPEDPVHAENTLHWLLKLKPDANAALQLAALAHDIDRADEKTKVRRTWFQDYDMFKAAHAQHSADITKNILEQCDVDTETIVHACRLIEQHETGGDLESDLLKDADSISYFDTNLPEYFKREGRDETLRRCMWGYQRLSPGARNLVANIRHDKVELNSLLRLAIQTLQSTAPR